MPETCKSSGVPWSSDRVQPSGGRVSNAWVIYLSERDNTGKLVLIPHTVDVLMGALMKDFIADR